MSILGIAALQSELKTSGNLPDLLNDIRATARRYPWVQMIVLGELAAQGPKLDHAEPPGGPTETAFRELAEELGLWIIPGSLYERRGECVFNTTPVIDNHGSVVARHDKIFPFLPYENGVTPGEDYCVFDMPGVGRIGVAICYDMWFPEVIRTLCAMGAEMIVLPTMTNTVDRDVELSIARANAAVNQCFFIDVNVAGDLGNGRSIFFGPGGDVLCECGTDADTVALELDFNEVRRVRERGWNGLGQVMKSFRDATVSFPFHNSIETRQQTLEGLGPLEMPSRKTDPATPAKKTSDRKLRVIE